MVWINDCNIKHYQTNKTFFTRYRQLELMSGREVFGGGGGGVKGLM